MTGNVIVQRMRDQVREILRDRIISGVLANGERLEEIGLAEELGVSRTPLREALLGLEQEGLVQSRPHRGYSVAPLDPEVVRQLYPLLGALEGLAVELSLPALEADAPHLRELNARLSTASSAKAGAADKAFHAALRRRCPNPRLLALLAAQEATAHRLDGAMRRGMVDVGGSHDQHDEIIRAIAAGDATRANLAVREHWRRGADIVTAWMEQHDAR